MTEFQSEIDDWDEVLVQQCLKFVKLNHNLSCSVIYIYIYYRYGFENTYYNPNIYLPKIFKFALTLVLSVSDTSRFILYIIGSIFLASILCRPLIESSFWLLPFSCVQASGVDGSALHAQLQEDDFRGFSGSRKLLQPAGP